MKPAQFVLPALIALALSACGSGSDGPPTASVPPPVTAPVTAPEGTASVPVTASDTVAPANPAGSAPAPAGIVADPADRYRAAAGGGGVYFFTPTRNIACGLDAALVGCQVGTTVIPPGATCDQGDGPGAMPVEHLSKGYASQDGGPFTPSCFNQGVFALLRDQKTLEYGHSVTAGGMTCTSERRGVTCRRGGHGFFVSAQSFERW
ncbi:hypothetical protein FK529_04610 [Tsukamurella asaccharolytica]|uniref:Serine/threonine protein kinase n=1 Tax=Tsukamurella asaccharolytica TaxID=2592067 RepID=A0A5C5RC83_9ACTN|nr:hypothetical protein [Tsukamurella asaccharolytica]TWS20629.1 hypothetical protein FK529_04610 [Tsukamurella asaccharolytica]